MLSTSETGQARVGGGDVAKVGEGKAGIGDRDFWILFLRHLSGRLLIFLDCEFFF
jgi:hypothetical protein